MKTFLKGAAHYMRAEADVLTVLEKQHAHAEAARRGWQQATRCLHMSSTLSSQRSTEKYLGRRDSRQSLDRECHWCHKGRRAGHGGCGYCQHSDCRPHSALYVFGFDGHHRRKKTKTRSSAGRLFNPSRRLPQQEVTRTMVWSRRLAAAVLVAVFKCAWASPVSRG